VQWVATLSRRVRNLREKVRGLDALVHVSRRGAMQRRRARAAKIGLEAASHFVKSTLAKSGRELQHGR
jgi:hypothetical protein